MCRACLSYMRLCLGREMGQNLLSDWNLSRTDGRRVLELSFGFHHNDEVVWNPWSSVHTQAWRIVADTIPGAIFCALSPQTHPPSLNTPRPALILSHISWWTLLLFWFWFCLSCLCVCVLFCLILFLNQGFTLAQAELKLTAIYLNFPCAGIIDITYVA